MAIIPIFGEFIQTKLQNPSSQRKIILVIVSVALLLDNMLYMVIVPIIPDFLRKIHAIGDWRYVCHDGPIAFKKLNASVQLLRPRPTSMVLPEDVSPTMVCGNYTREWAISKDDATQIGVLFASKAILQLFCNPITGTIIDRVGYDWPMMIGLMIIFLSTTVFAFGQSYAVMFVARSLQGLGSAFADTAGLAMIADRFTEEQERSKALGIALAFISFGSLVAPPFGGILYGLAGKIVPFIMLAFVALADGFIVMTIMRPERKEKKRSADGEVIKGTPIHRLLVDPYIAICAGALAMSNVSLAFLEPTIADWMDEMMHATSWEKGLVWLPAFIPHVAGVYTTVKLARVYPQYQWLMAAIGLAMEGTSCLLIPYCTNFVALMIPISIICYGIALVDTALLPTMGFLVDTRHVSVYGSVYAIADIAYSLAYAFGPIMAGGLVANLGFLGLNISIFLSNVLYVPILWFLRSTYSYDNLAQDDPNAIPGQPGLPPGVTKETDGLVDSPGGYRSYMVNGGQGVSDKSEPAIDGASIKAGESYGYENGSQPRFEALPGVGTEYGGPPAPSSAYGERPIQYQTSQPPMPPTQHHQPQPRAQWDPESDDPTIRQSQLGQGPPASSGGGRTTQRGPTGRDRTVTQIRKDDYGY